MNVIAKISTIIWCLKSGTACLVLCSIEQGAYYDKCIIDTNKQICVQPTVY